MKKVSYKDPYEPLPIVTQIEDDDEEGMAEILMLLNEDARITQNMERKEMYHTEVHLEGLVYEGQEYASDVDVEASMMRSVNDVDKM